MNIWQQLEIEPTSDLKVIKRAYAKKLKITRPDDQPDAFQDLHYAYKAALYHASRIKDEAEHQEFDGKDVQELEIQTENNPDLNQNNTVQISDDSNEEIVQLSEPQLDEPSIISETHPVEEVSINPFQVEGERLLAITQQLLSSDGVQALAKSWEFLIESEFILEDHFNWRLGLEVLQLIREHNLNNAAKPYKIVGRDALTYLDSVFNWIDNRHHVLQALGNDYSTWLDMIVTSGLDEQNWQDKIRGGKKFVLAKPKKETITQLVEVDQMQRLYAWFIDLGILFFFILLLRDGQNIQTKDSIPEDVMKYFIFGITVVYFWLFESSMLQASIGKRIMKLRVVDTNGNAIGFLQGIIRTSLYCLFYLLPYFTLKIYLLISHSDEFSPYILLASWFLIGAFGFGKITLYDKLSRTRVFRLTKMV